MGHEEEQPSIYSHLLIFTISVATTGGRPCAAKIEALLGRQASGGAPANEAIAKCKSGRDNEAVPLSAVREGSSSTRTRLPSMGEGRTPLVGLVLWTNRNQEISQSTSQIWAKNKF